MDEVGFTMLARSTTSCIAAADRSGRCARRGIVSGALLSLLRFDFNPLNLKSSKVESMSTLQALASDPDWTPSAINILCPHRWPRRSPWCAASMPCPSIADDHAQQLRSHPAIEKLALVGNAPCC